jgi:hypothetical protein
MKKIQRKTTWLREIIEKFSTSDEAMGKNVSRKVKS